MGQGNDAGGKNVLGLVAPAGDGPLRLGVLSPDEADEHVDTSDGEEEERGNESEGVDAMGEDSSANEALDDPQGTSTELHTQNREEAIEERHGPAALGHKQEDHLEDDQQPVEDGPEDASRLVGNGASQDVVLVEINSGGVRGTIHRVVRVEGGLDERVKDLDVVNQHNNATSKDKKQADHAQDSHDIQANKDVSTGRQHVDEGEWVIGV